MIRRIYIFLVLLAAAAAMLLGCTGCDSVTVSGSGKDKTLAGWDELLEAYEQESVFVSASHDSESCVLTFDDRTVTVPLTSFEIHDCTIAEPSLLEVKDGYWSVDGAMTAIKADSTVPREEAVPVYVYFDDATLYMTLSNREALSFWSVVLEERKEAARRQNIPVVTIETAGGAPILDKKNYVEGTITISDPEMLYSDVPEFTSEMGIRGRGNSTWSFPKKPWKVKLDSKASLLGMPADKEWCLLANYADRTLVRNIVAMELSRICGFSWTPRMRSVEVYLNGEYQGVYTLCEHKKVSSDRVDIDVAGASDIAGDALTGGYYLEMEEQQDAVVCWWTEMGVPMMFSEPEEPTAEQIAYVKGLFSDFEKALRGSNFADPENGYAKYIDVDSFINYYIVQELTKNVDGNLRKSSFITKERGGKMEMYHLWDFDLTLGNSGLCKDWYGYYIKDYTPGCWIGENWFNRMFRDPVFTDKVQARWNELLPQLREIPDFIDDHVSSLQKAQQRNFELWGIENYIDWVGFPSLGSYEAEVEYLKEFYTKRLEWLTDNLNSL